MKPLTLLEMAEFLNDNPNLGKAEARMLRAAHEVIETARALDLTLADHFHPASAAPSFHCGSCEERQKNVSVSLLKLDAALEGK